MPSTVVLIEVATGKATTLVSDRSRVICWAAFERSGGVVVYSGSDALRFDLDGQALGPGPISPCKSIEGTIEIAGQRIDRARCSVPGLTNRWVTYDVESDRRVRIAPGLEVNEWDKWVFDAQTRERRLLQAGLVPCGGCDGRWVERWSPTGRYVAFSESGGTGRRWLADLTAGTTRPIGNGADVTEAPAWSADGRLLLLGSHDSGTTVLDVGSGEERQLPLPWPAAFDRSGTLAYSPAWRRSPKDTDLSTTIVDAASGASLLTLPGAPLDWRVWVPAPSVVQTAGSGVVSALQGAPGCDGTAIYVDRSRQQCVARGVEGVVAAGGAVAVARQTGATGAVRTPGLEASGMAEFAIDVVGASGIRTVLTGVVSARYPLIAWNEEGTYQLVAWPFAAGI